MTTASNADGERKQSDLTREELWVPPLHEEPDAWARDNAYFQYRLLKSSPKSARLYVGMLALSFVLFAAATRFEWLLIPAALVATGSSGAYFLVLVTAWRRRRG